MKSIVNFLMDYYLWILAVLGIIIVTIIGFLADSKQKRKRKEKEQTDIKSGKEEVKTVEPLPKVSNNEGQVASNVQTDMNTQNLKANNINGQVLNNLNMGEASKLDSNISQSVLETPVSLSEQTPSIMPNEINIPNTINNVQAQTPMINVPQQVNAVPINNHQVNMQPTNITTSPVSNYNGVASNPITSATEIPVTSLQQPLNTVPISNQHINMQPTNMQTQPVNNYNNVVPTSTVMPSQMPVQQNNAYLGQNINNQNPNMLNNVVSPIPSVPVTSNVVASITEPVPQVTSVPTGNTPNIGLSFVTGDNAQPTDDTWKL